MVKKVYQILHNGEKIGKPNVLNLFTHPLSKQNNLKGNNLTGRQPNKKVTLQVYVTI